LSGLLQSKLEKFFGNASPGLIEDCSKEIINSVVSSVFSSYFKLMDIYSEKFKAEELKSGFFKHCFFHLNKVSNRYKQYCGELKAHLITLMDKRENQNKYVQYQLGHVLKTKKSEKGAFVAILKQVKVCEEMLGSPPSRPRDKGGPPKSDPINIDHQYSNPNGFSRAKKPNKSSYYQPDERPTNRLKIGKGMAKPTYDSEFSRKIRMSRSWNDDFGGSGHGRGLKLKVPQENRLLKGNSKFKKQADVSFNNSGYSRSLNRSARSDTLRLDTTEPGLGGSGADDSLYKYKTKTYGDNEKLPYMAKPRNNYIADVGYNILSQKDNLYDLSGRNLDTSNLEPYKNEQIDVEIGRFYQDHEKKIREKNLKQGLNTLDQELADFHIDSQIKDRARPTDLDYGQANLINLSTKDIFTGEDSTWDKKYNVPVRSSNNNYFVPSSQKEFTAASYGYGDLNVSPSKGNRLNRMATAEYRILAEEISRDAIATKIANSRKGMDSRKLQGAMLG
jgi:hypothetical protein